MSFSPEQPWSPEDLPEDPLPRRLNLIGLCLLGLFGVQVLRSLFPWTPANPLWSSRLIEALVSNGAFALIGLVLVHLAAALDVESPWINRCQQLIARWAVLASLGYFLLIPFLGLNLWFTANLSRTIMERQSQLPSQRLVLIRGDVAAARTFQDLQDRLRKLGAPVLPPSEANKPFESVRASLLRSIQSLEGQVQTMQARGSGSKQRINFQQVVPTVISALLYGVAFAVGAQRKNATTNFFDEILRFPLFLLGGSPSRGNTNVLDYADEIRDDDTI